MISIVHIRRMMIALFALAAATAPLTTQVFR